MISPKQIALLHCAKTRLRLEDREYRMILKNVADVASSKALTQAAFEDVMAVLEERAEQQNVQLKEGGDPNFWRTQVENRKRPGGNSRLMHLVDELAAQQPYPLPALVRRYTAGAHDDYRRLLPFQLVHLVEMLKEIVEREARKAQQGQLFTPHLPTAPSPYLNSDGEVGRSGGGESPPVLIRTAKEGTKFKQGSAAHAQKPAARRRASAHYPIPDPGAGALEDVPF